MADYQRLRTPLTKMSFTPDVPSNALGTNEYNSGLNVETDVRGIKKIFGEQEILTAIPAGPIFMEGGFRSESSFVYIVATRDSSSHGKWYMVTTAGVTNITPGVGGNPSVSLPGYIADLNITTSWVGNVFFINDTLNNPMYFLPTATEITITPDAQWNYDVGVTKTTAGFIRNFCAPNVGNVLVAGNLTKISGGITSNFPTTVRWSQSFGLQGVPGTWAPTLTNIANEQEVPVRGPLVDGFFLGGNFFICSYWDTIVLSPIAYQNSTAPVFGVRLFNQGRGLLNNNCWTNTDQNVYGIDSRDIWVFDGSNFNSIGNQRVKDYFFSNLNSTYYDRVFMVNNTQKYQIEIYYPDLTSSGWCNKMLAYRYDLKVWQPPRQVSQATMATESPRFNANVPNLATRGVVYSSYASNQHLVQKDIGTSFLYNQPISTLFQRNNISFGQPYSNKVQVHRILPEVVGTGNVNITVGGADSVGANITYRPTVKMAIDTNNPWVQIDQNDQRVVSVKIETTSNVNSYTMTAINWQNTIIEDDR